MDKNYRVETARLDELRSEALRLSDDLSLIARSLAGDPSGNSVEIATELLQKRSKRFTQVLHWAFPAVEDPQTN